MPDIGRLKISPQMVTEGKKLSDAEVEELLSRIDKKTFKSRDEEEVAGYAELMNTIFDNFFVIPKTQKNKKLMYNILIQFHEKQKRHLESKINSIKIEAKNDNKKLSRNQRAILELFNNIQELDSSEIADKLGMNIETVKKNVKVLVASGFLTKIGETKGTYYKIP